MFKIKITQMSKNPWREICEYEVFHDNRNIPSSKLVFLKGDWDVHNDKEPTTTNYYCGYVLISFKALAKIKDFK